MKHDPRFQQGLDNIAKREDTPIVATSLRQQEVLFPEKSILANIGNHFGSLADVNPQNVIESGKPLSQCLLWDIQLDFYRNLGIKAWDNCVPFFVTNSIYIAEAYAEMVVALVRDCPDQFTTEAPLYIVEMATGTGRFSYHMIRELERKMAAFEATRHLNWVYVMTDFTEDTIAFWENHERFAHWVAEGRLDFAIFMPEVMQEITLRHSGRVLNGQTAKNPIFAVANYFLDSIRMDLFQFYRKRMDEGQITLRQKGQKPEPCPPDWLPTIQEIDFSVTYKELANRHYYENEAWNDVLNFYRHHILDGEIIFPCGALRCMDNMRAISNNRWVLLSSDKSYTDIPEMILYTGPMFKGNGHSYVTHNGAFSFMVNYDALGRYTQQAGGRYFATGQKSLAINTVCCVDMPCDEAQPLENLRYLFAEKIDRNNPITSIHEVINMTYKEAFYTQPTPAMLLALLRLTYHEPKAFMNVAPKLLEVVDKLNAHHIHDLLGIMDRLWQNYYHFKGEVNLPFWLAHIYANLGYHDKALTFYQHTIDLFGEDAALYFAMAECYRLKGTCDPEAKAMYEKTLALDPEFPQVHELMAELTC